MKIIVYKGFNKDFYRQQSIEPLIANSLDDKFDLNILSDNSYNSELAKAILSHSADDTAYITYEEFVATYETLMSPLFSSHTIEVVRNNLFPEIYPLQPNLTDKQFLAYQTYKDSEKESVKSDRFTNLLLKYYNDIYTINDKYYVTYHNNEIKNGHVECSNYYKTDLEIEEGDDDSKYDYLFDISDEIERYIECYDELTTQKITTVAYRDIEKTEITALAIESLMALCLAKSIKLIKLVNESNSHVTIRPELKEITKTMIESNGGSFSGFKSFKVYTNPRISHDTELVSQGDIMEYIAQEAENAANGRQYRDIFFTAPTGAGKSITFQTPARYIADKYGKLVIIIEPLKGLMRDQVDNLKKSYGNKVDYINSDIATQADRDRIIEGIKNEQINILYVSPETLISRTIESLIGDREIGLLVVDEAHIVTAWGMGFRPDYWYLGAYINRLRSERNGRGLRDNKKQHRFPIFACTATAVNGGLDDTVSETFISLTMNDPIVILGYARRDEDIKFDIHTNLEKMTKNDYKEKKADSLARYITNWHKKNEKSIIYTPYRTIAENMKNASNEFMGFDKFDNLTGIYTGGGTDPNQKNEDMDNFKSGKIKTMYATKAFGMGVDVKDVNNVYHYAPTGSLADYVQEIGRVARKEGMVGTAITDYYIHDMQYINALYGMSQITKTHIMQCLRIIYDTYKQKGYKQRFVVAPSMFDSVFPTTRADDIEAKLKIALLMIEKDFRETYRIPVFVSRPGTVFTNSFVQVTESRVKDIINSRYGKYFIEKTRHSDGLNNYRVYEVKLSEIWEKLGYDYKMSFPEFKYHYYNYKNPTETKIMPEIFNYFTRQEFLSLEAKNGKVNELYDLAKRHIDFIVRQLTSFGGRFFTIEEFSKKLSSSHNEIKYNRFQADSIANSFFSVVDPFGKCVASQTKGLTVSYRITNGNLRTLAEAVLEQSGVVRDMQHHQGAKYERYIPLDSKANSSALKMLSLFDIASYTVEGGSEPQISIWVNSPDRIRQIVTGRIQYYNKYVKRAAEKHKRSVRILRHFFENLITDDERWSFIERYFLGEDVLNEIIHVSTDKPLENHPIESYIIPDSGTDLPKLYSNWEEFIAAESANNSENFEKYLYVYKQFVKANIRLADQATPIIQDESTEITPLFVFKDENVVILSEYAQKSAWDLCEKMGWKAFGIDALEDGIDQLVEALQKQ